MTTLLKETKEHIRARTLRETGYQKYITVQEWELIKTYLEQRLLSPSARLAIYCLAGLGLRIGECLPLKRSQFTPDFDTLRYQPLKKRKQTVIHEIAVPSWLQEKLKAFDLQYNLFYRNDHLFFPFRNKSSNYHLQISTVHHIFKEMTRELSINDTYYARKDGQAMRRITPHTLRHFFAYNFCMSAAKVLGDGMKATQERLCHEKLETTAKYINALKASQAEKEIVNKMEI